MRGSSILGPWGSGDTKRADMTEMSCWKAREQACWQQQKSFDWSFEQKITNIAPMNKSDIVHAPKNSWTSRLSLKITRVRDSPTSSREFPGWTSAGSTLRNRDLQPSLGSCRSPHPVALYISLYAVTTWHARSFKIILHVKPNATDSYWQVFKNYKRLHDLDFREF